MIAAMRIAVLGGGHGSYAAAADLAEQGHEVRLWRRDAAAFAPVLESSAIRLKDVKGSRRVRIALATTEIGAALRGAELVLVPTPATAQTDIARAMSACAVAGVGTRTSSAPRRAAPISVVASAMRTLRAPFTSFSRIALLSSTGAKAAASRRHRRTSWPCSARSAAAA